MATNIVRHSIGKQKAIELGESHWWELCSDRESVEFQLFTKELCMPFRVFHEKIERVLGRPVFTHEFGLNYDGIVAEFMGERESPSFEEVLALIPAEKRVAIVAPAEG